MYDYFNVSADSLVHSITVTDIGLDELEFFVSQAVADIPAFDLRVVKVIEIIDTDHRPIIG